MEQEISILSLLKSGNRVDFYRLDKSEENAILATEEEIFSDVNTSVLEGCAEAVSYILIKTDEMQKYLNDTDWYITRKAETNKEIPSNVLEQRVLYREKISEYRVLLISLQEKFKSFYELN